MPSSFPVIKITFIPLCLILSLGSTSSFAKEYYKWVDAKGSTHYTTTPPPKSAQKKAKVETYGWNSASTLTSPNRSENSTAHEAAKEAEKAAQESRPVVEIPQIPESAIPPAPSMREADRIQNPTSNY